MVPSLLPPSTLPLLLPLLPTLPLTTPSSPSSCTLPPSLPPTIHSTQHVLLSAISSSIAAANGVVGEKEGRREGRRSDLLLLPEMNRQIRGLTWLRYSFGSLTQWVTNSWYHPQQILPHFFTYDIRAQCRLYIWFGSGLLEELYHI